jgi:transcriptional regulator with XRE-family HTH domain
MTNYKAIRKKLNLSREQIAAEAGVSLSTVIRAENGKAISRLAAAALATALAALQRKAS